MTKSDHVNHKNRWLVQNGCQKWKERDEICKFANFEALLLKREILW